MRRPSARAATGDGGRAFESRYGAGSLPAFLDDYGAFVPRLRETARTLGLGAPTGTFDRYAVYAGMLDLLTAAAEETPIRVATSGVA